VRHVTLSSGQLGRATASLGLQGLQTCPPSGGPWRCLPLLARMNVARQLYVLAFRLALARAKREWRGPFAHLPCHPIDGCAARR
jgi:hypothetical protein